MRRLKLGIDFQGQRYVDRAVERAIDPTPAALAVARIAPPTFMIPMAQAPSAAAAVGLPLRVTSIVGYERVRLRWIKPESG